MASKKRRAQKPREFRPGNPVTKKIPASERKKGDDGIRVFGDIIRSPYAKRRDVVARDEYLKRAA